jgi:ribosomal protein L29
MTRHIRAAARVWINIYPDRPADQEARRDPHGLGKGSPEWWIANVKPGRVMFELSGVPEPIAKEAMRRAMHKLPMKCRFVRRRGGLMSSLQNKLAAPIRSLEDDELVTKLREAKEELFNLRFQAATGQLESHGRLNAVRKDIARIYTVMRERELGISAVETDVEAPA